MAAAFRETLISQIPALQLLMALGYEYLTPAEVLALRGQCKREVLLSGVLAPWLRAHNVIEARGQRVAFSEANIQTAIRRLTDEPLAAAMVASSPAELARGIGMGSESPVVCGWPGGFVWSSSP